MQDNQRKIAPLKGRIDCRKISNTGSGRKFSPSLHDTGTNLLRRNPIVNAVCKLREVFSSEPLLPTILTKSLYHLQT